MRTSIRRFGFFGFYYFTEVCSGALT